MNADGTPIDASGNPAYTGGTGLPHLRGSGSSKNPAYNVDDYAWRNYTNAAALAVVPGSDGTVDNKPIRLDIVGDMRFWNGSTFVATGGESVDVSAWTWTTVNDDGVGDAYDTVKLPDGGWYAYPDGTVRPGNSLVQAGSYEFAPGDHYHWLLQLKPAANGIRDTGVYGLRLRFATSDDSAAASETFDVLLANGLGDNWEDATHNPTYSAAYGYLAANPDSLAPVPEPGSYALLGVGIAAVASIARQRRVHQRG